MTIDLYVWAFLGSIVGAILLDITEMILAKMGITKCGTQICAS